MINPEVASLYPSRRNGSNVGIDFANLESSSQFWMVRRGATESDIPIEYCFGSEDETASIMIRTDLNESKGKMRHMHASINSESEVFFDLATIDELGSHHPDLFARKFAKMAIKFFESMGHSPKSMIACWGHGVNLDKYWKLRNEGYEPVVAAMETWTGRLMSELGFGDVRFVSEKEEVHAFFEFWKEDAIT